MAHYKIPYKGLTDSLKHFRVQVLDSIPYCVKNIPDFKTPEELFYYLKSKTKYKNDPSNIELFQSAETLLENNWHNESGAGDCDCFSCLCLASLICNGWYNVGIVLSGKTKHHATHIYTYVETKDGRKILDLTNKNYNEERFYPFKQFVPFKISKNQINMFLQLADNGNTKSKRRIKLGYNPYLFIPSKGLKIREDIYDELPLKDFCDEMLSEGYDLDQVSTLAGRRAVRKERQEIKTDKKRASVEKTRSKTDVRTAKAEKKASQGRARETSAEAKRIRAEQGEQAPINKIFDQAGDIIGKFNNQGEFTPEEETEETDTEETQEQTDEELNDGTTFDVFGMQIPKTAVYIGAGLLVLAVAVNVKTQRAK